MKKSPSHESGFTFVEVMIALVLLASASAILVGMQSAAVHRTIRDTSAQKSMMVARRIMAMIETIPDNELNLSSQGEQSAIALMEQLQIPTEDTSSDDILLTKLSANLQVDDWLLPVPGAEDTPMKKIILSLSWGNSPQDHISIEFIRGFQIR